MTINASQLAHEPSERTRAVDGLAACVFASMLALAFAGPAQAVETVDLGDAEPYSVLAGSSVTSTGSTAMSENLGIAAGSTLVGAPIVLGETHLADAEALAAKDSFDQAYADALLRPSALLTAPADFANRTYTAGVYGTPAARAFSAGTLTLDAEGDPHAVFIFQIGGALSVAASTTVALVGEAQACNVFWTVAGATTIGATARFAGTMMSTADITVGANTRVDGRVLTGSGAITLAANAIHTASCATPPPAVVGPQGPAGAGGTNGTNGAQGATGLLGPSGVIGATGRIGAAGADGNGAIGPAGPAGPVPNTTTLCVTNTANLGRVRQGGLVTWTIVVKNCGERAALGVSVTDRPRTGASLRTRGGGGLAGGQLRWTTGTLAPGASRTYKITTCINRNARAGRYVNRATADADNTAPTTAQGSTTVRRPSEV